VTRAKGVVPALLAYILWGLLPIYWKLLQVIPPDRIIALRIVWSFVFVTLLLLIARGLPRFRQVLADRKQMRYLGLAAILITINWFTYIYAVNNGMMVESSLGYYINPLVSILLGVMFYKERFRPAQVVAIALAIAGVAVMIVEVGQVPWVGLILAVSFGFYGLIKKRVSVDATVGLAVETAVLSPFALLYLLFTPAAGLLAASTTHDGSFVLTAGSPLLYAVIPLSGILTATPLLLFAFGSKHLDLSMMGFLQYIAPTMMLLLGVFAYGESFTTAHAVCFGLIWAGIALYMGSSLKERRDAAKAGGTA
jgi:chloramphenicol-sensitive protein RarD